MKQTDRDTRKSSPGKSAPGATAKKATGDSRPDAKTKSASTDGNNKRTPVSATSKQQQK